MSIGNEWVNWLVDFILGVVISHWQTANMKLHYFSIANAILPKWASHDSYFPFP